MRVTDGHQAAMHHAEEPAFRRYSFVVLTYVHDQAIRESVNVGLLMVDDETGSASFQVRSTIGRLSNLYGNDLQKADLIPALRSLKSSFDDMTKVDAPLLDRRLSATEWASQIMPFNESSLQWGDVRNGITPNLARQMDHLFDRFVVKYDDASAKTRSDEAVWAVLREKLVVRNIERHLTSKKIVSEIDEVRFDHAWKNGVWHVYQALSFELATPEGIQGKAARWSGHMLGLENAFETIKPHFIVAPPKSESLMPAYLRGIALLEASPLSPEVFVEDMADELADRILEEMRGHDPRMLLA